MVPRGHSGKYHVTAKWYPDLRKARVDPPARGIHFQTIGTSDSNGDIWLEYEELLYLVERGSLECFAFTSPSINSQDDETVSTSSDDEEDTIPKTSTLSSSVNATPMSLQAVYAAVFSDESLYLTSKSMANAHTPSSFHVKNHSELERYQVYANLKKNGYIVRRSKYFNDNQIEESVKKPETFRKANDFTFTPIFKNPLSFFHSNSALNPSSILSDIQLLFKDIFQQSKQLFSPYVSACKNYLNSSPIYLAVSQALNNYYSALSSKVLSTYARITVSRGTNIPRSYGEIFDSLNFIPSNVPPISKLEKVKLRSVSDETQEPLAPYRPVFNVWKPTNNFRKSDPGEPDFVVAVINSKHYRTPTRLELMRLLNAVDVKGDARYKSNNNRKKKQDDSKDKSTKDDSKNSAQSEFSNSEIFNSSEYTVPNKMKMLKYGFRQVQLAVVDSGIINYTTVTDAPFGRVKIYYQPPKSNKPSLFLTCYNAVSSFFTSPLAK